MLVRDIMHREVRTFDAGTTLADAYRLQQEYHLRHLPVLREGSLVGVVTDRDLRLATSVLHPTPFPDDARVEQVMATPPITATPLDPVEEAARLMRAHKIGCLPVLDGPDLVGIVTGTDLLDALIRLSGAGRPSGRLAVRLEDAPGRLAALMTAVADRRVHAHSVLSYPADDGRIVVILRVNTLNTHALAAQLRAEGFAVTWPPETPWSP
ncbi:acetoin dehydrogenase [Rhodothermaceae bacterium RA]|nr:acetoin dehydrogenase [Rhodothermaceae bacterium RA]